MPKPPRSRAVNGRAAFLEKLVATADAAWADIDVTQQRGTGGAYDQALRSVQDLSDAYAAANSEDKFREALAHLMAGHGARKAWVDRLTKAQLLMAPLI